MTPGGISEIGRHTNKLEDNEMAEAELMITPDIAIADLRRSMATLDRAMAQAAKKAGDEFKDEVERGLVAGAKRGAARMGGMLKRNAGGIAGGVVGVLAAGLGKAIADFDTGTGLIESRMGESDARVLMGGADVLGIDAASMAKLWDRAKLAGFDDARDFVDILTNIQLKKTEAETGEDATMNQFKGLGGAALFDQFFASMAKQTPEMQAYFYDKMEGGERLTELSHMTRAMQAEGLQSGWLTMNTAAETQAGMSLLGDEAKVANFIRLQSQAQAERNRAEMDAITGTTLKTWMEEQNRITQQNANILRRYEQNATAAIPARVAMEKALTKISDYMLKLVGFGERTANSLEAGRKAYQEGGLQGVWDENQRQLQAAGLDMWGKKGG